MVWWICKAVFQSTLPVRGATSSVSMALLYSRYFNPRSPCGERRPAKREREHHRGISIHAPRAGSDAFDGLLPSPLVEISIHAPRAGSDSLTDTGVAVTTIFQSTLPVRGATLVPYLEILIIDISIHAPRAGSDDVFSDQHHTTRFQSTLPVRGATVKTRIIIRIFK